MATEHALPIEETNRLIASDKVQGTEVYDPSGNHLGEVENVMIDKVEGKVAYAVVSFGGFLGIGERYHPLPWRTLSYDTAMGGYVTNLTRDQLERAPHYAADEAPWSSNANYGRQVTEYYGLPY